MSICEESKSKQWMVTWWKRSALSSCLKSLTIVTTTYFIMWQYDCTVPEEFLWISWYNCEVRFLVIDLWEKHYFMPVKLLYSSYIHLKKKQNMLCVFVSAHINKSLKKQFKIVSLLSCLLWYNTGSSIVLGAIYMLEWSIDQIKTKQKNKNPTRQTFPWKWYCTDWKWVKTQTAHREIQPDCTALGWIRKSMVI